MLGLLYVTLLPLVVAHSAIQLHRGKKRVHTLSWSLSIIVTGLNPTLGRTFGSRSPWSVPRRDVLPAPSSPSNRITATRGPLLSRVASASCCCFKCCCCASVFGRIAFEDTCGQDKDIGSRTKHHGGQISSTHMALL